jgi:pyruvate dehydrogenase phosphatase
MLQPLPVKAPPKPKASTPRPQSKEPATTAKEISSQTSLSSHPTKQARYTSRPHEIKLANLSQQDYAPTSEDIAQDGVTKPQGQTASTPTAATFGKLANKMKLMLRRKNTNAKKKEKKKREYEEVDRIEDVHWTEM